MMMEGEWGVFPLKKDVGLGQHDEFVEMGLNPS